LTKRGENVLGIGLELLQRAMTKIPSIFPVGPEAAEISKVFPTHLF